MRRGEDLGKIECSGEETKFEEGWRRGDGRGNYEEEEESKEGRGGL